MNRVLFVFGLFVSTFTFSQVEEGTLMTRYSTLYEYNTYTDEFEKVSEGWITSYLTCNNDYYFLKIEDGDEGKVFYNTMKRMSTVMMYIIRKTIGKWFLIMKIKE